MKKPLTETIVKGFISGRLVATGKYEIRPHPRRAGRNQPWFECECSCGKERKYFLGYDLRSGQVKSCGCLKYDAGHMAFKNKLEKEGTSPQAGAMFGNLRIVNGEIVHRARKTKILCLCKCGSETWKDVSNLIKGKYSSCGDWRCRTLVRESSDEMCMEKLYAAYRSNAQKRDLEFSLTEYEFRFLISERCHKCILTSMEHRAREWFLYRSKAIYQPHYDVDALHAICEFREVRQ